jgi:hypothetical protein
MYIENDFTDLTKEKKRRASQASTNFGRQSGEGEQGKSALRAMSILNNNKIVMRH